MAEVGVDDLERAGGEEFAGAGVAGGLEFGHEGFVAVDFAGEELIFDDVTSSRQCSSKLGIALDFRNVTRGGFATVGGIGHS